MCAVPTGLGHHQAGSQQHRHLPGSSDEQVAEERVPAAAAAAGAEERRWTEERVRGFWAAWFWLQEGGGGVFWTRGLCSGRS